MIKDKNGNIVKPEELFSQIDENGYLYLEKYTFENESRFPKIPDSCHSIYFDNCTIDRLFLYGKNICNLSFVRCISTYITIYTYAIFEIRFEYSNINIELLCSEVRSILASDSRVSVQKSWRYRIEHILSHRSSFFLGDNVTIRQIDCDCLSSGLRLACPESGYFIG